MPYYLDFHKWYSNQVLKTHIAPGYTATEPYTDTSDFREGYDEEICHFKPSLFPYHEVIILLWNVNKWKYLNLDLPRLI